MQVWAISLPNVKYGAHMPAEDSFTYNDNVFCVADGVTRDPIGLSDFTNLDPLEALEKYPNPSRAAKAAELCSASFVGLLENNSDTNVNAAMVECNKRIAELNQDLVCDYLENDYAATVAVGGKIVGNQLYWASIGDCQVAVFSKDGQKKFISPDGTESWGEYERKLGSKWSKPEYRVTVRRDFRNNPEQIQEGKLVSFGVLTGEKTAESFIMSGQQDLVAGDIVIFYTDGFMSFVDMPEFSQKIRDKKDFLVWQESLAATDLNKLGKERTIIVAAV